MAKSTFLALLGGLIVIAAFIMNFLFNEGHDEKEVATNKTLQKHQSRNVLESKKTGLDQKQNGMKDIETKPSFDIVRINPEGNTVIAGRAAPKTKVEILDRGKIVGNVSSDKRGEWVFVPSAPLPPGSKQLSLRATDGGGNSLLSDDNVVLVIPEKGRDITGKIASKTSQPLALKVPTQGNGAVEVLQNPNPPSPNQNVLELLVDAIDYNESGQLSINGHAPKDSIIQVYLDNQFYGKSLPNERGIWTLSPDRKVKPGIYTLRADQLDQDGNVIARREVVFGRSVPLKGVKPGTLVVVESGNSLWRIARRTYGSGFRYTVIYEANKEQIRDADLIFPGQVFALPAIKK